jgi:hypothetical protein
MPKEKAHLIKYRQNNVISMREIFALFADKL